MHGAQQEGGLAHPIGERGAVEDDALPGVDLGLAVERQVVGVFGHKHMGDGSLGRDAALHEPRGSRRLHHHLLASPAGVLRPARDDDAELGGQHVEALGHVLAHHMELAPAAGAGPVGNVDDPLDARQVCGQRAAVRAASEGSIGALRRIGGLLVGEALRLHLLGLLETQEQLVDGQTLGPASEAMALQLLDDLAEPIDLGLARHQHRLQGGGIIRQACGRLAHGADSIMDYNALPAHRPFGASTCCDRDARLARVMHAPPVEPFHERLQLRRR